MSVLDQVAPAIANPEDDLDLIGSGFGSNFGAIQVIVADINDPKERLLPIPPQGSYNQHFQPDTEISAAAPDVYALEMSTSYQANTLSMYLKVEVAVAGATPSQPPPQMPLVTLDRPQPGAAWTFQNQLYFGNPKSLPPAHRGKRADGLGNPDHGTLVLYSKDPSTDLGWIAAMAALEKAIAGSRTKAAVFNDLAALATFQKFRNPDAAIGMVVSLSAAQKKDWHDYGLVATIPPGFAEGYAVVWRDSIPSAPQHFLNFCQFTEEQLGNLINDAYASSPIPEAIQPWKPISLAVVKNALASAAGKQFQDYLAIPGAGSIHWTLALTDPDGNNNGIQYYIDYGASSNQAIQLGSLVTLYIKPDVYPQEKTSGVPMAKPYVLQLTAELALNGSSGQTATPIALDFSRPAFSLGPLAVPTVAIFFTDAPYSGAPLVTLPKDTALGGENNPALTNELQNGGQGVHWDYNNDPTTSQHMGGIADALDAFKNGSLHELSRAGLWGVGGNELADLETVILRLRLSGRRAVIDSRGGQADLEGSVYDNTFGVADDFDQGISSVLLIGAPGYGISLAMFGHNNPGPNQPGDVVLSMPSDHLIASIPHFSVLLQSDTASPVAQHGSISDWNDQPSALRLDNA